MDSKHRFIQILTMMMVGLTAVLTAVYTLQAAPPSSPDGLTVAEWKDIQSQIMASAPTAQQAKLTANDAAAGDNFGFSVAIDGETAVVGAWGNDDNGSAYIFTRSGTTWSQQAKLIANDAAADDFFGVSVAINGETAVIGASRDDDGGADSGSAYIFTRSGTTWSQQAKLTASNAAAGDNFGNFVTIDGDTTLIGAPNNDDNGANSGSVYVFTRSGTAWNQQAKLNASVAAFGDFFGYGVAIDGETAVIGSHGDDDDGQLSGSAYIFTRSGTTWNQQAKLTAADAASGDRFGISVAVDGETAVIGSYLDDDGGIGSGSAYVFVRSGNAWSQQAKLTADDAAPNDQFGFYFIAVDGDMAVVGANRDDDGGTDSGSAYVFVRSGATWSQQDKLTAADAAAGDQFGFAVAMDGQTIIVGAAKKDDNGINSGSAYVFFIPPTANNDAYVTPEDGVLTVIAAAGVISNDSGHAALSVTVDNDVSNGTLTLDNDGGFVYTPTLNFNGVDNFSYILNDGVLTNTALVTLTVTAVNDAPIATNDAYTTEPDVTFNQPAPGLLSNDTDIDMDGLTAVLDSSVSNGTLSLSSDGSFIYTPAANFCGVDSFTYHANDGMANSNVATVTLNCDPTYTIFLPMVVK